MFNKIFRSIFFTSMLILLMSFSLAFGVLYAYFETQTFKELQSEAEYIADNESIEIAVYLAARTEHQNRITWIARDGTVLADTRADIGVIENHADRQEVKEATMYGSGKSTRYSHTLMEKTLYYAIKLDDESVLRVSTKRQSVVVVLLGLMQPLIVIIVLALILSLFLSHNVSKTIIKPINALDLENPSQNETYEELSPLLRKLSAQKKTIAKQIKEAEQSREEFKLITENMSEGLLIIDKDLRVLTCNRAAKDLLEAEHIKGGSVFEYNRSTGFRATIETALSGERSVNTISHQERIYSLTASPAYEEGNIVGAVVVIIDITESAKREQLRREFTSNVSHELKTPLTSISGFAEMMKSGGTPEETVIDFSTAIYDEAQRLITLVLDIIKISELDEGAALFKKQEVDLYALSESIIKRLMPFAEKKNISMSLCGGTARVEGVLKILDEMIYNLCDNAIKYNKEGGRVDIEISQANNKTTLTVKDTGIGIPANAQDRVFERFYRVDKSHSKRVGGTGLGLAIVKHAAMYHGAELLLESVEGMGTSVTVVFPHA